MSLSAGPQAAHAGLHRLSPTSEADCLARDDGSRPGVTVFHSRHVLVIPCNSAISDPPLPGACIAQLGPDIPIVLALCFSSGCIHADTREVREGLPCRGFPPKLSAEMQALGLEHVLPCVAVEQKPSSMIALELGVEVFE